MERQNGQLEHDRIVEAMRRARELRAAWLARQFRRLAAVVREALRPRRHTPARGVGAGA